MELFTNETIPTSFSNLAMSTRWGWNRLCSTVRYGGYVRNGGVAAGGEGGVVLPTRNVGTKGRRNGRKNEYFKWTKL